jgi:hypothetical protein
VRERDGGIVTETETVTEAHPQFQIDREDRDRYMDRRQRQKTETQRQETVTEKAETYFLVIERKPDNGSDCVREMRNRQHPT